MTHRSGYRARRWDTRLVSLLAIEANDEWLIGRAYISQKSMASLDATSEPRALALEHHDNEVDELIAA